jgi:hypothetical protein
VEPPSSSSSAASLQLLPWPCVPPPQSVFSRTARGRDYFFMAGHSERVFRRVPSWVRARGLLPAPAGRRARNATLGSPVGAVGPELIPVRPEVDPPSARPDRSHDRVVGRGGVAGGAPAMAAKRRRPVEGVAVWPCRLFTTPPSQPRPGGPPAGSPAQTVNSRPVQLVQGWRVLVRRAARARPRRRWGQAQKRPHEICRSTRDKGDVCRGPGGVFLVDASDDAHVLTRASSANLGRLRTWLHAHCRERGAQGQR